MNRQKLTELLHGVRDGRIGIENAIAALQYAPFEDLGFAKVDHHRSLRCGFPEVIYCPGKTPEQVVAIAERLLAKGHGCLATRVEDEQAALLQQKFPDAELDSVGRTFWIGPLPEAKTGRVIVVTAGTADLP